MKQLYFLLFFSLSIIACNSKTSRTNDIGSYRVESFVKIFEGNINGNYEIMLKIVSDSGNIKGNYFYKSKGINIPVTGKLDENGNVELSEFSNDGNQTGVFKGKLNGTRFDGIWSKPNGDKQTDFTLIESSTLYEASQNEFIDQNFSSITGTYEQLSDNGVSTGTLEIKYLGNKKFQFDLIVVGESTCTGEISGVATLNNGTGKYSDEGCRLLTFTFSKSKVSLKESECYHHGVSCSFEGDYVK